MRDLGIVAVIAGLAILAAMAGHRLLRNPGQRAARRSDASERVPVVTLHGAAWAPAFLPVKKVGGAPPWQAEPLEPLPEQVTERSPAPFMPVAAPIDVNQDAEEWRQILGDNKPARPAHATDGQTTGEIFEHLHEGPDCWCLPWKPPPPPGLPEQVREKLNDHHTVDAYLDSLVMRAEEAAGFRAELGQALQNGQVPHA